MIFSRAFLYIDLIIINKLENMKKILYVAVIAFGSIAFTSCASGEECVCDNGVTITEDDAKDSSVTLSEACNLAIVTGSDCEIK